MGDPEVVQVGGSDGVSEEELLVHRQGMDNTSYAYMLSRMTLPEFPVPFGVLRAVDKPAYTDMLAQQVEQAVSDVGAGDLVDLYHSGGTWEVSDQ